MLIFIAREIQVLDGQVLNKKDILNKLHNAMQVSKGYGIFLPKNENYDVGSRFFRDISMKFYSSIRNVKYTKCYFYG